MQLFFQKTKYIKIEGLLTDLYATDIQTKEGFKDIIMTNISNC